MPIANIQNPEEIFFTDVWKFQENPFKAISAEEIPEDEILDLFIFNDELYYDVFNVNSSIIRGFKGTGKTMLLRAIYTLYTYRAYIDISNEQPIECIPVFINLSNFNHIQDPKKIYMKIIATICEEIIDYGMRLDKINVNAEWLGRFLGWVKNIFNDEHGKYDDTSIQVIKTKISKKISVDEKYIGALKLAIVEFNASYNILKSKDEELGIGDIEKLFQKSFHGIANKILIVFDEVSSLQKNFFLEDGMSYYKILMNQLRTGKNIYYKIGIYPHHYSDCLEETRFGNSILLTLLIKEQEHIPAIRKLVKNTISSYVKNATDDPLYADISNYITIDGIADNQYIGSHSNDTDENAGDAIEQIIFGSRGIYRRIIQILSSAFIEAAKVYSSSDKTNPPKITKEIILKVLNKQGEEFKNKFPPLDIEQISKIATVCRKRSTSRFSYKYATNELKKFLMKGDQDNVIYLLSSGTGRSASIFEFDYACSVFFSLPTHKYIKDQKVSRSRSLTNSTFITKTAELNKEFLHQDKYFGRISKIVHTFGFIESDNDVTEGVDKKKIFFHRTVFKEEFNKSLIGREVSFEIIEEKGRFAAGNVELVL